MLKREERREVKTATLRSCALKDRGRGNYGNKRDLFVCLFLKRRITEGMS